MYVMPYEQSLGFLDDRFTTPLYIKWYISMLNRRLPSPIQIPKPPLL